MITPKFINRTKKKKKKENTSKENQLEEEIQPQDTNQ